MCRPVSGRLGSLALVMGLLVFSLTTTPALAQGRGDYFNVESPQGHPIEIAEVGNHFYILVCNTADNSVEIWDSDENLPIASRFLARVPVGLEPVSVRWVPSMSRFYVANFLGDSISAVTMFAPTGPSSLVARVVNTRQVTDEPLDIAFANVDDGEGGTTPTLFVTHMTLDAYGEYNAFSLNPVASNTERMDALVPQTIDHDFDGNPDDIALKAPRTLGIACEKLFILGFMGGNTIRYDFDLYSEDLTGAGTTSALGGLGSTNWNMEFADDNNLFVVGAEALNASLVGETNVKNAQTGFVENIFYWVQNPCSDEPNILRRDVNEIPLILSEVPDHQLPVPIGSRGPLEALPGTGVVIGSNTKAVAKKDALVQLTDIELLKDDSGGVKKAFFTAYGSDRVGIIEPNASQPEIQWARRKIDTPPVNSPPGTFIGARGLILKAANTDNDTDPGDRLYVVNRLESSVTIIDPLSETVVGGFPLNGNPNPPHIQAGREFLYSAKLSGKGFVACASCHPDGRTDGLAWQLSDFMTVGIPQELLPFQFPNFPTEFPKDKGYMVTQSLQGLLNWDTEMGTMPLVTNAPYHWRGDRETFRSFNGAFSSLMGGSELEDPEIIAYEDFINSIHYPPNPKQPRPRLLSGKLGGPTDDDDDADGTINGESALLGLKIFHIVPSDTTGTCNGCHSLPEGSNNMLTENIAGVDPHPIQDPNLVGAPAQPIETAALRFLFQKEARLDRDGFDNPDDSPITGYEGVFHTGLNRKALALNDFNGTATMNAFNARFFQGMCPTSTALCGNLFALNQFLHEFDTGTAPQVGTSYTVTPANQASAATAAAFQAAEDQADVANAAVAVVANLAGVDRGFWLDYSGSTPLYREEPGGATFSRAGLLAQMAGIRDRMMVLSTPLGSEIRVAAPSGVPTIPSGPIPSRLTLQSMVTNTAHTDIPQLTIGWDNGNPANGGSHNHTIRLYQNALLVDGPPGGFGLCTVRHEAPRRLRVSGLNIRHGAQLHLFVQDDASLGAPNTSLRLNQAGQVPTVKIELPIHPTDLILSDGSRVWETAAELEPLIYYRLMAGIPSVTPAGILDKITARDFAFQIPFELQPPSTWKPVTWNNHWVRVVNTDGTLGEGGWQPLTIEPGPLCP
ncbi:MAG: hypothetical protein K0U98_17050 [Deltaproteobacteria bacterium]|nr:hypothetical protein [Deltaproteobacteria bacterium]